MAVAPPDTSTVPSVTWDALPSLMKWRQGEHVALVGPTGSGKTTAALSLITLRDWVILFSTKPRDRTLRGLRRRGFRIIKAWPPPADTPRIMVHAPLVDLEKDPPVVGARVRDALNGAYKATSWTVVLDDLQAMNDTCGLARTTRVLLLNARSSGVTVIVGTQRPRWVPREVWTQCEHLFIWRCSDADDLRALAGLGSADSAMVRAVVTELDWDRRECLYVNARTGKLARVIFPPPT